MGLHAAAGGTPPAVYVHQWSATGFDSGPGCKAPRSGNETAESDAAPSAPADPRSRRRPVPGATTRPRCRRPSDRCLTAPVRPPQREETALCPRAPSRRTRTAQPALPLLLDAAMEQTGQENEAEQDEARRRGDSDPSAVATGLSRRSPTVAPSGRVRMNAAQNNSVRETLVQK